MSPETVDKIQEALEPLAAKLGEGAAYSWEVLVRQMLLHGVVLTALGIVTLVLFVYLFVKFRQHHRTWNDLSAYVADREVEWHQKGDARDEKAVHGPLAVVFGLGSATSLFLAGLFLSFGLLRLANPAYYAIRELARIAGVN